MREIKFDRFQTMRCGIASLRHIHLKYNPLPNRTNTKYSSKRKINPKKTLKLTNKLTILKNRTKSI